MMKSYNLFAPEEGQGGGGGGGLLGAAAIPTETTETTETTATPVANPQQATATPISILGEDGKFAPQWYKGDPDLEPLGKQLDKFNDPKALAKSYAHLEKSRSVPTEGADAAVIDAFRKANNIPATSEEYKLDFPEALPEGIAIDEAFMGEYKKIFHTLNLTPLQAQKLAEGHLGLTSEMFKGMQAKEYEATQQAVGELRKEWGIKFDANLATAQKTFDTLCTRAGVNPEEVGFTNDPKFAKIMASVSVLLGESPIVGATQAGASLKSGKQEATEIMTNSSHPDYQAFYTPTDPRHGEVQDRVARLNRT